MSVDLTKSVTPAPVKVDLTKPADAVMVPLDTLTGPDLTKAIRAWAVDNGLPVGLKGAIAPEVSLAAYKANPLVPAPTVKAKRAPAAPKVPNVFDVHCKDGAVYTVAPGQGKSTIERLAEKCGVAVDEIDHVTKNGEVVNVPNRQSAPVADPWLVELTNGQTREYRPATRGRMNVAKCANELGIKATSIKSVSRGDKVYRVAQIVSFTTD